MGGWDRAERDEDRQLRLLAIAGLIGRFNKGMDLDELYESALRSYDMLLDIVGESSTLREVSETSKVPEEKILASVEKIIDFLLFNKEDSPFISLGLSEDATEEETNRRWKKLILLYHPDRFQNQESYEERAKKINEAYNRLNAMPIEGLPAKKQKEGFKVRAESFKAPKKIFDIGYLKYIPVLITVIVALMAAGSIFVFVLYKMEMKKGLAPETAGREAAPGNAAKAQRPAPLPPQAKKTTPVAENKRQDIKRDSRSETLIAQNALQGEVAKIYLPAQAPKDADKSPAVKADSGKAAERRSSIPDIKPDIEKVAGAEALESVGQNGGHQRPEARADTPAGEAPKSDKVLDEVLQSSEVRAKTADEFLGFIDKYIGYFEKGNLDAFMSLFAREATENGKPVSSLVDKYRKCFTGAKIKYALSNVSLGIKDNSSVADIAGDYRIERFVTDENKTYEYAGRIRWVLEKDGNSIKIIKILYD